VSSQETPSTEPVKTTVRDEEEDWGTMGAPTGGNTSPPPAIEEAMPMEEHEQPTAMEVNPQPSAADA
jgi:hypothetical protein